MEGRVDAAVVYDEHSDDILMEPYHYLQALKGKNVRGQLIQAFNAWLHVEESPLTVVQEVVTMLHNASLLVDDIEDNSELRRGQPVAHSVYGIPHVINSANYVYFKALERVAQLHSVEASSFFVTELLRLHHGQGYDIFWRDHNHCPTEDDYRRMVLNKTGGLFRLAVHLMQCFSDDKRDLVPLVNLLGLFFQIRDDLINLYSREFMVHKGFCEDLTEGKFSFPIIHSIRSNPTDHRLLSILQQRTSDVNIKRHAVEYMHSTHSFAYTVNVLRDLRAQILDTIASLGGNPALVKIVQGLSREIDQFDDSPPFIHQRSESSPQK